MNIIEFDQVSFAYDTKLIINKVSFTIHANETVAIIGGSGSGKTTLLKLITGQCQADLGSIKTFNKNINNISKYELLKLRKNIGMLFQFGGLFTDMTVYDNIAFPIIEHFNFPKSLVDKIVALKLHAVGLFGAEELFPQQLSGGMARRVALARSIILDPKLMLYDEPFTGLDPISLEVIAMLIKKLTKALNQTVVIVTHDIQTALKVADRIIFLYNGSIIFNGTIKEILESENPQVKQFIHGKIDGPYKYEYNTTLDYDSFINNKI